MSSYIISKADDNDSEVIQQLEEMYQVHVYNFLFGDLNENI